MKRIMYIENKENGLSGQARIGWVELSRSIGLFRNARFNSPRIGEQALVRIR